MISLNILTDFCSYWWLWWILPFVLGCLLGTVVMKKWRTMYEDLIRDTRKARNQSSKTEQTLAESLKEISAQKAQIAIQKGHIRELEQALKNKES